MQPRPTEEARAEAEREAGVGVRDVQHLSRHAKIETLMKYDDSRDDKQGKVSRLLSGLL